MEETNADVVISGITHYSQSRHHDEPKLEGESVEDWQRRCWRSHMTVNDDGFVVIPGHGMMQCLTSGARYSKKKIPNEGRSTWAKKFEAGVAVLQDPVLNVKADDVRSIAIFANLDGRRGGSTRGTRVYPIIHTPWTAAFNILILDPVITQDVFTEMLEYAGLFVGVGRFRPERGGLNGRFRLKSLDWKDNRQLVAASRRKAAA